MSYRDHNRSSNYSGGSSHNSGHRSQQQGGYQNRDNRNDNRNQDSISFDAAAKAHIQSIIEKGFTETSMKFIEEVGAGINGVSSSQIRIAYGEVTRLKMKKDLNVNEVLMLKPKLAYAAGRATQNKNQYIVLKDIISYAVDLTVKDSLDSIEKSKRFQHLASMFEAILAYHKANNGK
jgi:CRISPR type III-A-associated protein Csm2